MTSNIAGRTVLFLALLSLSAHGAAANNVFVLASGAVGRGITRTKAGECFVVTPEHVVSAPGPIRVIAFGGGSAQVAAVPFRDKANDVAILAVSASASPICDDADWPQPASINSVLATATRGSLLLPNESGTRDLKEVRIDGTIDQRRVPIKPPSDAPKDRFVQGYSGGVFVVNDVPVGMLFGVDLDRGEGVVLRFDYISGLIAGFFDAGARVAVDPLKMRTAIARLLASADSEFEAVRGPYDGKLTDSSSTYIPSVMLPGAERGVFFRETDTTNFITWHYPRLESLAEATTLYEAVSRSIGSAVPRTWRSETFKNGSDFILSAAVSGPVPENAGPKITTSLKGTDGQYEVEVAAHPLDTEKLVDVDTDGAKWNRSGGEYNYKLTNLSDLTLKVALTIKIVERDEGSSSKETVCSRKEFEFTLAPRRDNRVKGSLNCRYDEDTQRRMRHEIDVTVVK